MGMCAGAPPGREALLAAGADALDRPQLAFPQPTFLLPAYVGGIYKSREDAVDLIHRCHKTPKKYHSSERGPPLR